MAVTVTPSSKGVYKRWGPPCLFCTQSTPHASPVDSDWPEEDWDRNIEEEKRREKQRKEEEMKQRQEIEEQEKIKSDPNYYLPSPIYVPSYEEEPPALVRDLVPDLAPEKTANMKESEKEDKTEEERRIMLELLDEENELGEKLEVKKIKRKRGRSTYKE